MAELDPAELATVLDAADRYLDGFDWNSAYNVLYPVSEANVATGNDLGRLNFGLGEACVGLGSNDAALAYYQAALAHQSGMAAETTLQRIQSIATSDAARDSAADGVNGETEAGVVLQAATLAYERMDFDEARRLCRQVWDGLQMTEGQIAATALMLAELDSAAGDLDSVDGYLEVALAHDPGLVDVVARMRVALAERRAGGTLGEDGVAMTELDEINQSALQASWNNDFANAKQLFEQMLASDVLPATDRGRIHRNVGVMQIYLHDYEGARASFEEAARVGTPEVQALARASLVQLDANARAEDIVAGIDLSAN